MRVRRSQVSRCPSPLCQVLPRKGSVRGKAHLQTAPYDLIEQSWRDAGPGSLCDQITLLQDSVLTKFSGGDQAAAGRVARPPLTGSGSLDTVPESHLDFAHAVHELAQFVRLKRNAVIRAGHASVEREVLFDDARTERHGRAGDLDPRRVV